MIEDKLHNDINRSQQVAHLLDDEFLKEAYEQIEADLIMAWRFTEARDTDARERIWHAVQANGKHQDYLRSVFDNGKIAQKELEDLIAKQNRIV